MSVPSVMALSWLGQVTAAVALAAAAVWLLLRLTGLQSPAVHRFAWFVVLLQGIVFWRVSVELPVLPATDFAAVPALPIDVLEAQRLRDGLSIQSENESTPALAAPRENVALGEMLPGEAVWPWSSIMLGAWLCGIVVIVARDCVRYLTFCRALPPPVPARAEWTHELTQLCDELAIPRGRVLLQVTEQTGPALCLLTGGYRLLVPGSAWQELSAVQRQAILRHELAHCLRGDLWKSLLIRVLALPQWFNPLAWYAAARFDAAAEWACDDAVQSREQGQVFEYLRALVVLGGQERSGTSLQAAVRGGSLRFRVRRLSFPSREDSKMKKFAFVAATLVVAAAGLTQLHLATAQTPPASKAGQSQSSQSESSKAAPAPAPDGSLLPNGGFEEPQGNSTDPEAWFATRLPRTAGHFLMSASKSVVHSGKRSAFVAIGDNHPDLPVAYNWTAVAKGWKPGETYELSGWIKTEDAKNPAFIMAQFWSGEGTNMKMIGGATTEKDFPVKGTTDWTRASTRLKVPEGTGAVRIRAGLSSQGNPGAKAWLDDISLVKVAN